MWSEKHSSLEWDIGDELSEKPSRFFGLRKQGEKVAGVGVRKAWWLNKIMCWAASLGADKSAKKQQPKRLLAMPSEYNWLLRFLIELACNRSMISVWVKPELCGFKNCTSVKLFFDLLRASGYLTRLCLLVLTKFNYIKLTSEHFRLKISGRKLAIWSSA